MVARSRALGALGLTREKDGRRYERKLVRVERGHMRGGTVGPVGIVRELHRDAYVATFAFTATIDIDEHLAAA